MFGGGIPFGYLAAALSLNGLEGFEARFVEAFVKAEGLFTEINQLEKVSIRKFEHGSNIFELILDESIDTGRFGEKLLESEIVLNWPSSEWPVPLLHVNTTVLRKPKAKSPKYSQMLLRLRNRKQEVIGYSSVTNNDRRIFPFTARLM